MNKSKSKSRSAADRFKAAYAKTRDPKYCAKVLDVSKLNAEKGTGARLINKPHPSTGIVHVGRNKLYSNNYPAYAAATALLGKRYESWANAYLKKYGSDEADAEKAMPASAHEVKSEEPPKRRTRRVRSAEPMKPEEQTAVPAETLRRRSRIGRPLTPEAVSALQNARKAMIPAKR